MSEELLGFVDVEDPSETKKRGEQYNPDELREKMLAIFEAPDTETRGLITELLANSEEPAQAYRKWWRVVTLLLVSILLTLLSCPIIPLMSANVDEISPIWLVSLVGGSIFGALSLILIREIADTPDYSNQVRMYRAYTILKELGLSNGTYPYHRGLLFRMLNKERKHRNSAQDEGL